MIGFSAISIFNIGLSKHNIHSLHIKAQNRNKLIVDTHKVARVIGCLTHLPKTEHYFNKHCWQILHIQGQRIVSYFKSFVHHIVMATY